MPPTLKSWNCLYLIPLSLTPPSQEAFQAAKLAFRQFRLRVRKTLSSSYMGAESLENAMLDYVIRNLDLYDVQASVNVSDHTTRAFHTPSQPSSSVACLFLPL